MMKQKFMSWVKVNKNSHKHKKVTEIKTKDTQVEGDEEDKLHQFNNIMNSAKEIINSGKGHLLKDIIYTLGKPYQFKVINDCLKGDKIKTLKDPEHLFLRHAKDFYQFRKTNEQGEFINYKSIKDTNKKVHPSSHLIFTFPWNLRGRLIPAFLNIGNNVGEPWEHDFLNHKLLHLYPLNISYITNGNHSTVINIINNECEMYLDEQLDLTPIYKDIYTNGMHFKNKNDDSIIDTCSSVEFAAIFEIGRLIIDNNTTDQIDHISF